MAPRFVEVADPLPRSPGFGYEAVRNAALGQILKYARFEGPGDLSGVLITAGMLVLIAHGFLSRLLTGRYLKRNASRPHCE